MKRLQESLKQSICFTSFFSSLYEGTQRYSSLQDRRIYRLYLIDINNNKPTASPNESLLLPTYSQISHSIECSLTCYITSSRQIFTGCDTTSQQICFDLCHCFKHISIGRKSAVCWTLYGYMNGMDRTVLILDGKLNIF